MSHKLQEFNFFKTKIKIKMIAKIFFFFIARVKLLTILTRNIYYTLVKCFFYSCCMNGQNGWKYKCLFLLSKERQPRKISNNNKKKTYKKEKMLMLYINVFKKYKEQNESYNVNFIGNAQSFEERKISIHKYWKILTLAGKDDVGFSNKSHRAFL